MGMKAYPCVGKCGRVQHMGEQYLCTPCAWGPRSEPVKGHTVMSVATMSEAEKVNEAHKVTRELMAERKVFGLPMWSWRRHLAMLEYKLEVELSRQVG